MRSIWAWMAGWMVLAGLGSAGGCASSEIAVRNVHTVVPGHLVRGGQPDEKGFALLQKTYGIRTVINLNDKTAQSEQAIVTKLGMKYLALPSDPGRADSEKVLRFLRLAAESGHHGPIFVHCQQGQDRTGLAIAAYRMIHQDWSLDDALAELRRHQELLHTWIYGNIPAYLAQMDQTRHEWRRRMTEQTDQHVELSQGDVARPAAPRLQSAGRPPSHQSN